MGFIFYGHEVLQVEGDIVEGGGGGGGATQPGGGGGGGAVSKKSRASVWSKTKGGGAPRASPLDLPLPFMTEV